MSIDRYVSDGILGMGSFGKVRKARDRVTGQLVTVKKYKISSTLKLTGKKKDLIKGPYIVKQLNHPNISRIYKIIEERNSGFYYIIEEYSNGGSLYDVVESLCSSSTDTYCQKEMPFGVIRSILRQVAEGLDYMHRNGVVHLDVKPSNILLNTDLSVKITDFGEVRKLNPDPDAPGGWNPMIRRKGGGTPMFQSPQAARGDEFIDGFKFDVFSLGVTFYYMFEGTYPFGSPSVTGSVQQLYQSIEKCEFEYPSRIVGNSEPKRLARDLLERMLAKEEPERISMSGVLGHQWLSQGAGISEDEDFQIVTFEAESCSQFSDADEAEGDYVTIESLEFCSTSSSLSSEMSETATTSTEEKRRGGRCSFF